MSHPGTGKILRRPKEWDRDHLFETMLEWSHKPDAVTLLGFCDIYEISPQKLSEFAKEKPEYHEAFSLVKARVGRRREICLSKGVLHTKAYDVNAKVYDHFAKEEYREDLAYQASLKTDQDQSISEETKELSTAIMKQIAKAQRDFNARRQDNMSISEE